MEPLTPIPSPPGQTMREFQFRVLPFLAFVLGCIGVVVLWRMQGAGRTLTGLGEGTRAGVVSPRPATVVRFLVEPHTHVRRGDPIAVIEPFDPQANLDLLRTRVDLARLQATPTFGARTAVDVERMRIELDRTRSDLAVARVRLAFAEREVARNEPLARDKLVAQDVYELSTSTRDLHAAEVEEMSRAIRSMEARIAEFSAAEAVPAGSPLSTLETLRDSTAAQLGPVTLVAPVDGFLSAFLRQPGEFVAEGDMLVAVQSDRADRIVGYLRQPFGFEPRPGLPVVVGIRTGARQRFRSEIRQVAPQFETVTNVLAVVRDGMLVDAALPIIINVPPEAHIRPGEVVDLLIETPATTPPQQALAQP